MALLDPDECWTLLRTVEVGRLGIALAAYPEIFPINFAVDRETVVFRTGDGTKLAAVALGAAIAFEADGYDREAGEAWSVVIKGRAYDIEHMLELFDALDLPLHPWHSSPRHRFLRIVPDEITGRRFRVSELARPAAPSEIGSRSL